MNFLKSVKARILAIGSALAVFSNSAMAAVNVDSSNGTVSGTLDLAPFYSGASVVLTALASLVVIRWVISFFKRA